MGCQLHAQWETFLTKFEFSVTFHSRLMGPNWQDTDGHAPFRYMVRRGIAL